MAHIIDTGLETEEEFLAYGCVNWNLFLEWIEEDFKESKEDFKESKEEEELKLFLFDSWKL